MTPNAPMSGGPLANRPPRLDGSTGDIDRPTGGYSFISATRTGNCDDGTGQGLFIAGSSLSGGRMLDAEEEALILAALRAYGDYAI